MQKSPPLHFCPQNGLKVSVLLVPPYITSSNSGKVEGILGDFFFRITLRCFIEGCGLSPSEIQITLFNSTDDFISALHENETDIAFPISGPVMMHLRHLTNSPRHTGPPLEFEVFLESPGYFLIMDVVHVNNKVIALELKNLIQNSWPIVVFTLLIAGISGMVVWILVSHAKYQVSPPNILQRRRFRAVLLSTLVHFKGVDFCCWRRGGLIISAFVSGSSSPGSHPRWGHCVHVVFLGSNTDFILTVPLSQPDVSMGTGE